MHELTHYIAKLYKTFVFLPTHLSARKIVFGLERRRAKEWGSGEYPMWLDRYIIVCMF